MDAPVSARETEARERAEDRLRRQRDMLRPLSLVVIAAVLVGYFLKVGRASQETTELLLAQLEDAREEQLQLAAGAERSRLAAELHDVLAHALSGAAIQLQGARKLVDREGVSSEVVSAIER